MSRIAPPFVLGLLCGWLWLHAPARAQPAADEYDQAIRAAIGEFDAGHWEEARALFRRAHEISPNARTWRGLGITAFELRRYVDATRELGAALADQRKPLTDRQRQDLEALLARAREFVSTYQLTSVPAGAEVLVDGQRAELRAGELLLDPGAHALTLQATGYRDAHAELRADAGQRQALNIELEPESAAPTHAPAAAPPAPARAPAEPRPRHIFTWTLGGSGVAALGSAATLRLEAAHKAEKYRACGKTRGAEHCDQRWREPGRRQELAASVLFGVAGGLALSAALAFFLEGRATRTAPQAWLWLEPRTLGASTSFRF